jgi:hypothetical protein
MWLMRAKVKFNKDLLLTQLSNLPRLRHLLSGRYVALRPCCQLRPRQRAIVAVCQPFQQLLMRLFTMPAGSGIFQRHVAAGVALGH